MNKFVGVMVLMVLSGGAMAWGQATLPEDVRQVLPGRSQPQAVPRSRPSEEVKSSRPLEALPPASKAGEEEPLEQMLERAMSRYQSIVAEGNGLSWGADTEACLARLEAFLKTLKEEARRAAPKPVAPPAKGSTPVEKTSPVLPTSALLPVSKDSGSRTGAVPVAGLPSPEAGANTVAAAPPVPAVARPSPAPKAVGPAPTAAPANVVAAAPGVPWVTRHSAGEPPAGTLGPSGGQEAAEQLQQVAARCQKLAGELMDLADKLRKPAPAGNSQPLSTLNR